jgi:hypothetical protein
MTEEISHVGTETDRIRMETDTDVTFYHILNTDTDLVEYEYKMNVSYSDFYSDSYSIQLKVYILN